MTPDDLVFLESDAGGEMLEFASRLDFSPASRVASVGRVRERDPAHAVAVVDVVTARRRAEGRIRGAEAMLLTDEAVQQATHQRVAARRAARLADRDVHDLTCSVGAELVELVRTCPRVVGSDTDPGRARMARYNVPDAGIVIADAPRPASRGTVLLADPARRSGGRRVAEPGSTVPPLPGLLDAMAGRDHVVKCAPGIDYGALDFTGEVEVTSVDARVRETCLWSEGLTEGVRRRATVLRDRFAEVVTDLDPDDVAADEEADRYIVDPDGAVVRAGLVRHWAARHGLRQLDARIAHLTGPSIPPGFSGFEVLSRHRLDRRELRRELRERECGSLEILVRGVDVDPDRLRSSLSLKGSRAHALVVTRIGRSAVVFLCAPRSVVPRSGQSSSVGPKA